MCGRFALGIPKRRAEAFFDAPFPGGLDGCNIPPGSDVPVVLADAGARTVRAMRWGLAPPIAAADGPRPINARAETAAAKPYFRRAMAERRCLVPARAFYEWADGPGGKRPYAMAPLAGGAAADVFALAGLWERRQDDGRTLETFAVLTCAANADAAAVHHRMPVILAPEAFALWLGPAGVGDVAHMLAPWPDGALAVWPVSGAVNDPANQGPELLEQVPGPEPGKAPPRQGRLV